MINVSYYVYKECLIKKQYKNSFLIGFRVVYAYFLNLDDIKSFNHNKYLLNFLDDFTKKTLIN